MAEFEFVDILMPSHCLKTKFVIDATFYSCLKHFRKLHTIHVDVRSTVEETNIYPVLFALLLDKIQITFELLFILVKAWAHWWNPQLIKLDIGGVAVYWINTA